VNEFRKFLRCDVLSHGFARVRCGDCAYERLVPFSCKGRAVCPSCGGRRMVERASHLVDHVFPANVPVRQWVLSVPHRLRYRRAYDHRLCRTDRHVPLHAPHGGVEAGDRERLERLYGRVAEAADRATRVRLLAVRYQGLDTVGHWYLRYAEPARFGDVTTAAHARYGAVLDAYYGFLDGELGRLIGRLGPEDLLLVVSGFGMEPVSLGRRVLARLLGEAEVSGTHEEAPDGFLLAYGAHVARGRPARGSVADIAPTVLYYLGLPVGRDMDGFARTDLFTRTFRAAHPIAFIPSHDR